MKSLTSTILLTAALTLAGAGLATAQSLPNYGANAPGNGDSFGKPYSGAQPLANKNSRAYRSYASSKKMRTVKRKPVIRTDR